MRITGGTALYGNRALRTPLTFALVWLMVAAAAVPALASYAEDSEVVRNSFEVLGQKIPAPSDSSAASKRSVSMWPMPSHGLGFVLSDKASTDVTPGFQSLVSFDLVDGSEVGRVPLLPGGLDHPGIAGGQSQYVTVDDIGGRLFVAHSVGLSIPNASVPGLQQAPAQAAQASRLQFCAQPGTSTFIPCFGGFHIFDAQLNSLGRYNLQAARADGTLVSPMLRSMDYVPQAQVRDETLPDKVLIVVEDWAATLVSAAQAEAPRYNGANLTYLIQVDAQTGNEDWRLRMDNCRGAREGNRTGGRTNTELLLAGPTAAFRAVGESGASIYVACHGRSQSASIVRLPLGPDGTPASVPVSLGDPQELVGSPPSDPGYRPKQTAAPGAAQTAVVVSGPERTVEYIADPVSGRFLMRVQDGEPEAEVWWVFDVHLWQFLGTVGIGGYTLEFNRTHAGLDPSTGRLYVLAASDNTRSLSGGLYVVDIRRSPLPQALIYPEFASLARDTSDSKLPIHRLAVVPGSDGTPARIFVRHQMRSVTPVDDAFAVLMDHLPVTVDVELPGYEGRTLDLDEAVGVTEASFDGAARGFGARVLLVGGVDSVSRIGPADPIGNVYAGQEIPFNADATKETAKSSPLPLTSPCTEGNRELVLGMAGVGSAAVVDSSGGRASAAPITMDSSFGADTERPVSRCSPIDWDDVWTTALFGTPPVSEPRLERLGGEAPTECVSSADEPSSASGDPVSGTQASRVECDADEVSGYGYVRAISVPGVRVLEASSSFRVYRDAARGIVSRVESLARGVSVDGAFTVDSVRVMAESWASGRRFIPPVLAEDESYTPNCDFERTAGTCFQRQLFGLRTPAYSCGPCGDESRVLDAMNRVLAGNGKAEFRMPDPTLARGADNGFTAAITKRDTERFSDLVLNNDLLQTVLPGLEIVRYAPSSRAIGGGPRGRQVFQFAGVEVSSSYGIQCLLVYDEETNTCAAEQQVPGSINVSLTDGDGAPLAGGAFEVRKDVDADGVVGLLDTLLPEGACVTAEDGIGTCTFENLQPGSYLVTQTAAPVGFAKVEDTWASEVASGEARTVAFANTSNVSTIDVSATDEDGKPISGAVFAVYPDPDADGKIAADVEPVATCTTGSDGKCSMSVPVGSYVLVQTSAPAGLEGIEPVAFAFASGGQTAAVGVTNYGAGVPDVAPAAGPVYTEPVNYSPPVETVTDYTPPIVDEPRISVPEQVGSTVVKVIQAPGDVLRLLSRDPQQAAAWLASLILFALAAAAIRRRQQAIHLM